MIDNSQCDKDIKEVKFKLRRAIFGKAKDTREFKCNMTICKASHQGVAKGKQTSFIMEMPIKYEKDVEKFQ
jgi:hypothetical protein